MTSQLTPTVILCISKVIKMLPALLASWTGGLSFMSKFGEQSVLISGHSRGSHQGVLCLIC